MAGSTHQTSVLPCTAGPRNHSSLLATLLLAAIGAVALLGMAATPALAARTSGGPSEHGHGKGGETGGGGGSPETVPPETGVDISYPQCGSAFPEGQAFGIVGVNGGLANDPNACLGPDPGYRQSELYWAAVESAGSVTGQPKASLYVNTADPGNVYNNAPIADWPTEGGNASDGSCTTERVRLRGKTYTVGQNSQACAWQYGRERAEYDMSLLRQAAESINTEAKPEPALATAASGYPWWLDVETANTWQSGAEGQAMNTADLQGMVAAFEEAGAPSAGVYSTESQWNQITGGTTSATETLYGLSDWIPGASSQAGATANCGLTAFTGGSVQLTQWLTGSYDADHYCLS